RAAAADRLSRRDAGNDVAADDIEDAAAEDAADFDALGRQRFGAAGKDRRGADRRVADGHRAAADGGADLGAAAQLRPFAGQDRRAVGGAVENQQFAAVAARGPAGRGPGGEQLD